MLRVSNSRKVTPKMELADSLLQSRDEKKIAGQMSSENVLPLSRRKSCSFCHRHRFGKAPQTPLLHTLAPPLTISVFICYASPQFSRTVVGVNERGKKCAVGSYGCSRL
jgi:hypothetical protein